jgi:tripartite ATP-independent transporter DctM subunit
MTPGRLAKPAAAVARVEDTIAILAAIGVIVLPLSEVVLRRLFSTGIEGGAPLMAHLTLVVGMIGAGIAAREGKLLAIATGSLVPEGWPRHVATVASAFMGALVTTLLFFGARDLITAHRTLGREIALGVPVWIADLAFIIAFALIAWRLVWRSSPRPLGRALAAVGIVLGVWLATHPDLMFDRPAWPWVLALVGAAMLGMPIFALIGGLAVVLFIAQGDTPARAVLGAYDQLVTPDLPAIPLFTLAGFLLAEGHAPQRLLRLFRAFFGWMPGGTAVVTAVLCAFFTLLTGGSGVTILALGGLLLPALLADGYRERFSLGMLTAAGSLGLLFPPSLPLILYGIVAGVSIPNLFLGGFLPGMLMLGALAALGVREGIKAGVPRGAFVPREAWSALAAAKWELLVPGVIIAALAVGATTVQSAALAALAALIIQRFIHRALAGFGDIRRSLSHSISLVGGVLIVLAVAVGFTAYLNDAQVPESLITWTEANVESKWVFLLGLNGLLILVGACMDIFSAIIIVVPLVTPIAAHFQIDPIHLGIIFIANSELGYLTPPVGENLFVASYRFNKPILQLARAMVPMYVILLIGVLLITYVPWLTQAMVSWLGTP